MTELRGYTPEEQAESDAIDAKLRLLNLQVDLAIVKAAAEAAKRVPDLPLPGEVLEALGPLVKLAELLAKVLP